MLIRAQEPWCLRWTLLLWSLQDCCPSPTIWQALTGTDLHWLQVARTFRRIPLQ